MPLSISAQDSLKRIMNEERLVLKEKNHSPKTAAILSAVIPGAGQIYNRKYWKVPILYVAVGGLVYVASYNHDKYSLYRNAYKSRVDNDPNTKEAFPEKTEIYTNENLITLKNAYQRSRDITIIGITLVYILNIVDATVDAHFFSFDISDDLSLEFHPSFLPTAYVNAPNIGLGLTVKLKN